MTIFYEHSHQRPSVRVEGSERTYHYSPADYSREDLESIVGWWRAQARIASMGGAVLFLVLEMYEVDQKYGTKKERLFIGVHAGVELQRKSVRIGDSFPENAAPLLSDHAAGLPMLTNFERPRAQ